jgi:predicted Fe-S protein YdhL (DUF1289 family)
MAAPRRFPDDAARMMLKDREPQASTRPKSPCVNVCVLDATGLCRGCLRSIEEIARWPTMSPQEQWDLMATLTERWKLR